MPDRFNVTGLTMSLKMAKPTEKDIDAAGAAMSVLQDISSGYYPQREGDDCDDLRFDSENPQHLRRFYDLMNATLDVSPGWPSRVIGGMCYVMLYPANRIVDPAADTLELHPRFARGKARGFTPQSKRFKPPHGGYPDGGAPDPCSGLGMACGDSTGESLPSVSSELREAPAAPEPVFRSVLRRIVAGGSVPPTCWGLIHMCAELAPKCRAAGACILTPTGPAESYGTEENDRG